MISRLWSLKSFPKSQFERHLVLTQEIEFTVLDTQTDQTPDVHSVDLKTFNKVALFLVKLVMMMVVRGAGSGDLFTKVMRRLLRVGEPL